MVSRHHIHSHPGSEAAKEAGDLPPLLPACAGNVMLDVSQEHKPVRLYMVNKSEQPAEDLLRLAGDRYAAELKLMLQAQMKVCRHQYPLFSLCQKKRSVVDRRDQYMSLCI
jgi:hypothetical protein